MKSSRPFKFMVLKAQANSKPPYPFRHWHCGTSPATTFAHSELMLKTAIAGSLGQFITRGNCRLREKQLPFVVFGIAVLVVDNFSKYCRKCGNVGKRLSSPIFAWNSAFFHSSVNRILRFLKALGCLMHRKQEKRIFNFSEKEGSPGCEQDPPRKAEKFLQTEKHIKT